MKYKLLHQSLLLFVLLLASAQAAMAQFVAQGRVTDSNGEGLIGATIAVMGTSAGAVTDIDGNFRVQVPSGTSAKLNISYTGFKNAVVDVSANGGAVNAALEEDYSSLEEVIVTGWASNIKRSNAANAVSLISSKELTGVTTQQTLDGAMYGKFTGATINANSGAPGGGISMKFRGVTTLTGNSQPLFIIDGVYIDNSALPNALNVISGAYRDGRAISDQDNPSNRLADLDPEDIERVEILKGASSAAIYGSRAGTGVVIITTKRGLSGAPKVNVSQSIGFSQAISLFGPREWDEAKALTHFKQAGADAFKAAKAAGKLYDYEKELYGNKGLLSTTRFNVSGGSDNSKYFVGVTYKNEEGIVPNTGYERTGLRFNLDQRLSKWFDVQFSSAYTRSSADRGYFNNDNTSTTNGVALSQTPTWAELHPDANGNYPNNPYATANMLQTVEQLRNNESVNRIISGISLTTHLMERENQSLRLIVRGGLDNYGMVTNVNAPPTLQFQKDGQGTNGFVAVGNTTNTNKNLNAFLVHNFNTESGLGFRTQLGATGENFDQNTIISTAQFLIGSQTNVDQAGTRNNIQRRVIQRDRGFFAQEEINWDDKVIVTAGIRGDKSTNNGDANKLFYYPRASAAINLGRLADFAKPGAEGLSLVKVRAAFGQSGNFPAAGAIFTPLNSVVLGGNTGSLITTAAGDNTLGPERQTEIEIGADIGYWNDRVVLEATYYIKKVEDFLLRVNQPLSSGFTTRWANAGNLSNRGVELALTVVPVQNRNLRWSNQFNFWLNRSKIDKLNVPAFNEGGFAPFLGVFRIEEGKSPTQIVGSITPKEDTLKGDGKIDGLYAWGNAEPDFNLSWGGNLSWKKFDLNWLWHLKQGGSGINLTTLLYDLSGTTWDYDDKGLDPSGKLSNGDYRNSVLGSSAEPYIENTGYLRLREIGLSYHLGRSLWSKADIRIGVSGRNLLNFFKYNSYDPETSNFGFRAISSNIEVTPFPSSKSVFFTLSAGF
jgi:TonB-dependent starch-binding outer membrane protein SusC